MYIMLYIYNTHIIYTQYTYNAHVYMYGFRYNILRLHYSRVKKQMLLGKIASLICL